jgi:hypothetical protein
MPAAIASVRPPIAWRTTLTYSLPNVATSRKPAAKAPSSPASAYGSAMSDAVASAPATPAPMPRSAEARRPCASSRASSATNTALTGHADGLIDTAKSASPPLANQSHAARRGSRLLTAVAAVAAASVNGIAIQNE